MKHGQRLLMMGLIVGMGLCPARAAESPARSADDAESSLSAEYDAMPSDMHPDRWPGPAEPKEPTVSEKTETDVLEFLRKHMNDYYDRLMRLKRRDIRAYRKALKYLEGKVSQLCAMPEEIRDAHIRSANVQVEILRTARGYRDAKKDDDRNSIQSQLQKLLSEKFDIEQKIGEYRLKQLDKKLQERKKKLQERAKDRDKIITEELRCRLQPPAKDAGDPQSDKPEKTPTTAPATQPATPTTAPASQPS
jgi:hypothetical protein